MQILFDFCKSAELFLLLAVGVGVCYDLSLIRQTQELHLKYTVESPHLMQACRNLDYFSGVKTFVVDFIILCTLVMFHMTHIVHDNSEKLVRLAKQVG